VADESASETPVPKTPQQETPRQEADDTAKEALSAGDDCSNPTGHNTHRPDDSLVFEERKDAHSQNHTYRTTETTETVHEVTIEEKAFTASSDDLSNIQ